MQKSNLIKNFVASDLAKQCFSEVWGSSVRAVFKKGGCVLNNEIVGAIALNKELQCWDVS